MSYQASRHMHVMLSEMLLVCTTYCAQLSASKLVATTQAQRTAVRVCSTCTACSTYCPDTCIVTI